MPGLVRKLLIFAAVDGLVLQPLAHRGQHRPGPATKISYADKSITSAATGASENGSSGVGFEAFGIIGKFAISERMSAIIGVNCWN